jgi:hypothetical protein
MRVIFLKTVEVISLKINHGVHFLMPCFAIQVVACRAVVALFYEWQ